MLLFFACTGEKPLDSGAESLIEQRTYENDDVLSITQGIVLGSHNSYHQQPESETVAEWNYSHPPLSEQLDQGLRQFELDVHRDPDTGEFVVMHVPVLDSETSCYLLSDCLQEMRDWSEAHPWHFPLQILIEPKTEFERWSFFEDPQAWEQLEHIIGEEIGDKIFEPAELQGEHSSIRDAVLTEGWPSLRVMRGRMVFALLDSGEARDYYIAGLTDLSNRAMFPLVNEEHDFAAYFLKDNPYDETIAAAVQQGFLVRTRGDAGLVVDAERLGQAIGSGAHAISTDLEENHWWVEPEHPISCNPLTAIEACSKEDLE